MAQPLDDRTEEEPGIQVELALARLVSRFWADFGRGAAMPIHGDVIERGFHDYFGNVQANYLAGIWDTEERVQLALRCTRMCGQRAAYLATKDGSDTIYAGHFAQASEDVRAKLSAVNPTFRGDVCG